MERYKIALAALVIIEVMCIYPVSAGVQTDESVFKVTSFSGAITSPDGKETSFTSISDFEKCLENPIIAGSNVDIDTEIQLKGSVIGTYFLELSSDLTEISWDAKPNRAKPDTLWSDYSGTTYLWMTPSHDIGQIGVSIKGKIPQPTEEKSLEPYGSRTLIKEKEISILNIKLKNSISTFTYAENPQMFVSRAKPVSTVFSGYATATSEEIIETREKIGEMSQALSDLSQSLAGISGRDETARSLTGQYEAEKKIAETVERLFLEGYPDIAYEMAEHVTDEINRTNGLLVEYMDLRDKYITLRNRHREQQINVYVNISKGLGLGILIAFIITYFLLVRPNKIKIGSIITEMETCRNNIKLNIDRINRNLKEEEIDKDIIGNSIKEIEGEIEKLRKQEK